jgi:asparagine synthase (glutamine-hydrolysing)
MFERQERPSSAPLAAMLQAMIPRGPDDEGRAQLSVASGGQWHIGSRRLAILDLSAAGHQPMFDERTGHWLAYNGEVFNFRELRKELQRDGIAFRSNCDTEVVLKGYGHWGEAVFVKLEGMFALALWDAARQQMLLVRDRHGIKPLYYFDGRGAFLFASELRALLASGRIPRRLDSAGLDSLLKFGVVQEPASLVKGIRQLAAGHLLRWDPQGIRINPYVNVLAPRPPANGHGPRRDEVIEQLRGALQAAVQRRLVSDVPLGIFLSAGMDSGAIAALASVGGSRAKTFTVTFAEKRFAEGERARAIAAAIGTEHTELVLTESELLPVLPRALKAMDQPTVDGINSYFVSQMARQAGVTVALSGLGGDELFGGYRSFRQIPRLEQLGRVVPGWLCAATGQAIQMSSAASNRLKLAAWLQQVDGFGHPYFVSRLLLLPGRIAQMMQPAWLLDLDFEDMAAHLRSVREAAARHDPVNRVSCFELSTYMRNTLLRDTDCMSMAHSLEVRAPFLDHDLTDLMLRIPGAWKVNRRQNKPLLVEALGRKLPPQLLSRPKHGFEFPWAEWLRGKLRRDVSETLAEPGPVLGQALRWDEVRRVWQDFLASREPWSRPWLFYVLRKWTDENLAA